MISLPSKPKIVEKKEENRVLFEIDSLYPGYGVTIGNSLRRVLLSSLSGAAITKVKINEVNHEFSTIPGVMEDVITIILNLKDLRFRVHSDEPQTARIRVSGETVATGKNFELPTQLELVNPEAPIATLTDKKAELDMIVEVEKGMGYSSSDDRKEEKLEVGQIVVDSIFTPVKRVNFHVENMRVGKRTDFDRLFIEVETDRTISPEEALLQAVDVLKKHFEILSSFEVEETAKPEKAKAVKKEKVAKEDKEEVTIEDMMLEEVGVSTRIVNILKEHKIKKVKDILKKTETDINNLEGMGKKGVDEIKKVLKKKKLSLKEEK